MTDRESLFSGDTTAKLGVIQVKLLYDEAQKTDAKEKFKADWLIIENWLQCAGRPLNHDDYQQIFRAYRAYMARGIAPNIALEDVFTSMRKRYLDEGGPYEQDLPPQKVIDLFDGFLATSDEMAAKRLKDRMLLAKKMAGQIHSDDPSLIHKTIYDNVTKEEYLKLFKYNSANNDKAPEPVGFIKKFFDRMSSAGRILFILTISWVLWVLIRTSGSFKLLNIKFYRWDDDYVLANLIVPPLAVFLAIRLIRWIKSAKQ